MKHIIKSALHKVLKFLKKKIVIWAIIILAVIAGIYFLFFNGKGGTGIIQVGAVERQDLLETVLATGQVVSQTDLNLSFQGTGIVKSVLVKEGDTVKEGQILATLDQSSALASLTTARGALLQAQANYEKIIEGAKAQDIKVYQDAVELAKQDLQSGYTSLVSALNDANIKIYNVYTFADYLKKTYFERGDSESITVSENVTKMNSEFDKFKLTVAKIKNGLDEANIVSDLDKVKDNVWEIKTAAQRIRDVVSPIGSYQNIIASSDIDLLDGHVSYVNTALASITTAQQNVISYKLASQKAQSQLDFIKAPPTQAEVDVAQAQIVSAQGQVDSANATVNNLTIKAPADGTITRVDIRAGEQAASMSEVIDLKSIGDLYVEAYISEANVASLKIDQQVDYTFDALGPDRHFTGKILTINPASTVISGVVNYKVKGSVENAPETRPGMTANMTVMVAEKKNALAVPSTAVISKNNKKYVRVVDNADIKTFREMEVQTGLEADGGVVEILAGLVEGEKIIIYMRQ